MSDDANIAYAAEIEVYSCDCPQVHILLKDADGAVFAAAMMPLESAIEVANDIVDLVSAARRRAAADTIDHGAGHA